jgi:hypothetical protein
MLWAYDFHESSTVGGSAGQRKLAQIQFQEIISGGSGTKNGIKYHVAGFRSSDGFQVSVEYEDFESAVEASKEFEKRVRQAVRVIERNYRTDQGDPPRVERAVLQQEEGKSRVIVRQRGNRIISIKSESNAHALEFESRLRPASHGK